MNSENDKKKTTCMLFHVIYFTIHMFNSGWKDTDKSDQTKQPWQQQQQHQQ